MKMPPPSDRSNQRPSNPENQSMSRSMLRPAILAILAVSALVARPVQAQATDADLTRENERLTAEVRDLEAALEAALNRISSLEREIAALRAGGATAAAPPAPAAPAAPPAASAEAMILAIKEAHATAISEGQIPQVESSRDESGRIRQLRALRKWAASAGREFRTPVEWPIVVLDSTVLSPSEGRLNVQVWNPATSTVTGAPFEVSVPRLVVERVTRPRSTDEDGPAVLTLNGVFTPEFRVNENRLEVGAFDNPIFVGSMVEMAWTIDAKGVGPWSPAEATAVADED
jgi:hypothetical protein